jgi:hypothetical protein
MPGVWSAVTGATACGGFGGGDGPVTSSSFSAEATEATEIVVAATNAAKIIERMAFPP